MELKIYRRTSKAGNEYLVLEAVADWGRVPLSFDKGNIMQILPAKVNHREITEKGVSIGYIDE